MLTPSNPFWRNAADAASTMRARTASLCPSGYLMTTIMQCFERAVKTSEAAMHQGTVAFASSRCLASGTRHDVPEASQCMACHGGTVSRVLGFSAIQLSKPAREGDLNLQQIEAMGWLSDPFAEMPVVPGTADQRAALGTMHANCASCHN